MRLVRIKNEDRGLILAERAWHATGFFERGRGLLGRTLAPGGGMVLEPCTSVHSLGMGYALDLLFVDAAGVVRAVEHLKPWGFSGIHLDCRLVVELPEGAAGDTRPQDRLTFTPS